MKRYAVALGAFSFFCVSGAMAATESAALATGTNTDKIIHAKKVQDKLAKTKAREASHNPSLFDEYQVRASSARLLSFLGYFPYAAVGIFQRREDFLSDDLCSNRKLGYLFFR